MKDTSFADVKKIYATMPSGLKILTGPRNIFDNSDFRYVLKDNKTPCAFIEAKQIGNSLKLYYNIGFKHIKYCNPVIIQELFNNLHVDFDVKQEFITTYGIDTLLQTILKQFDFIQIASRQIILSAHLINDASHIHFMRG